MSEVLIKNKGFIEKHNLWTEAQQEASEQIFRKIEEEGLRMVRVAWADQHGISRAKTMTIEGFKNVMKSGMDFNTGPLFFDTANAIVFNPFISGGGFDLEELTGCPNYSLVPDPLTFRILPWAAHTGWILCDAYLKTGQPLPFDSRQVCRRALAELKAEGFDYMAGLEVEWALTKIEDPMLRPEYLGAPGAPGQPPKVVPVARGYQYQLEQHNDEIDDVLQLLVDYLVRLGMPLRTMEDEWGPSQLEFTFAPITGIEAADTMLLFRTAVKQIARRHGYIASFMCRPGIPGFFSNGWHLHQSLIDLKTGENAMVPQTSGEVLSETGKYFVGGILKHAQAATVFTTPTVNGFKRFKPNSLAPDRAGWGADNRGTMIRVLGGYDDPSTHFENRAGEPAANPYLYMASQIWSGLDGIQNRIDPGPLSSEAYNDNRELLPRNLGEALEALKGNAMFQNKMGGMFVDYISRMKHSELSRYMQFVKDNQIEDDANNVTEWEHREYFEIY